LGIFSFRESAIKGKGRVRNGPALFCSFQMEISNLLLGNETIFFSREGERLTPLQLITPGGGSRSKTTIMTEKDS